MLKRTVARLQSDRRTRHHVMLDGAINPREWYNWHPKEFQPWHFDRHKFLYEQMQFSQYHHLLCHQVYLKDMKHLAKFPEPTTYIIDCRTDTKKMHRWVPHSNWLPRDEVEYALQLTGPEFEEMYGFVKPELFHDIILVSHNGLASEQAGWEWRKQFFQHVYNYRGGTNELYGETYQDYSLEPKLKDWKGPFPQSGVYVDKWSKRKVLTRTGPFDRQYEMQDFALPDLELEKPRHADPEAPRGDRPWGLQ